jgi:hypothetical protein
VRAINCTTSPGKLAIAANSYCTEYISPFNGIEMNFDLSFAIACETRFTDLDINGCDILTKSPLTTRNE